MATGHPTSATVVATSKIEVLNIKTAIYTGVYVTVINNENEALTENNINFMRMPKS